MKIFEAGEYPQGSWPVARVKRLVDSYDAIGGIEAPGVVGHFENALSERIENELAYCWVRSLSMNEDGEVFADVPNEEISPQLRLWLMQKNLKYISGEIMPFDEMPQKGEPALVRIAFLGRSLPQIPTAKVPNMFRRALSLFSNKSMEDEKTVRWCGRIEDSALEDLVQFCAEGNPGPLPQPLGQGIKDVNKPAEPGESVEEEMTEEEKQEFENLKTQNAALQVKNESLSAELSRFKSAEDERLVKEKLVSLRDAGKITPAQFKSLETEVPKMDEESRKILFSAYESAAPVADLGAEHKAQKSGQTFGVASSLVQRIQAFSREKNLSYEQAAEELHRLEPGLFEGLGSGSVVL